MIREELLHPALSHFPIAFLIGALALKLAQLYFKKEELELCIQILLFGGSFLLLPTLFLGDMALDNVKNDLCRLTLAYEHEELGEKTLILAILASLVEVALIAKVLLNFQKHLKILSLFLLICCCGFLINTSHHGAKLVYEDGAGVQRELGKCPELPES